MRRFLSSAEEAFCVNKIKNLFSSIENSPLSLNLSRNGAVASLIIHVVTVVLLSFFAKAKGVESLGFAIPMFIVGLCVIGFAFIEKIDFVMALTVSVLINVGITAQILITPDNADSVISELKLSSVLAVAVVAVFLFIENRLAVKSKKQAYVFLGLLMAAVVAIFGILMCFPATNGTHAWIYINDKLQFQLTTLLIPLFILFESVLHVAPIGHKWIFSTVNILINAMALFVCRELGTLIIIAAMWIIVMFLFGDIKVSAAVLGVVVLLVAVAVGICFIASLRAEKADGQVDGLTSLLSRTFNHISQRVTQWINIKEIDSTEQSAVAFRSIIRGGLLGSDNEMGIGEERYDYTFASIAQRCGMLFGFVVAFLYVAFFYRGMKVFMHKTEDKELNVAEFFAIGSLIGFFVSSIIPIFCNTFFLPLIGIPLPLISSGMSSGLVCRFLVLIAMLGCKERVLFPPIKLSFKKKDGKAAQEEKPEKPLAR